MTHLESEPGWTPPPGTPLVTQADRWGWQRKAVRGLADILDAHPDLPQIVWTIGPTGALARQGRRPRALRQAERSQSQETRPGGNVKELHCRALSS
jgi:hypothetical protein